MSESVGVTNTPYAVLVESAKTYFWRSRGQSKKQPFCAGSQSSTDFSSVALLNDPWFFISED
jgi:CDGSH-type Zn-finger protein